MEILEVRVSLLGIFTEQKRNAAFLLYNFRLATDRARKHKIAIILMAQDLKISEENDQEDWLAGVVSN